MTMQYVGRVDRNFGDKLRISGSFLQGYATIVPTGRRSDQSLDRRGGTGVAEHPWRRSMLTYSFGPNLVTTLGATDSRALIRYNGIHAFPSLNRLGANFPRLVAPRREGNWGSMAGLAGVRMITTMSIAISMTLPTSGRIREATTCSNSAGNIPCRRASLTRTIGVRV